MPWKETDTMSERIRFVALALTGEHCFSALCRGFGISRTGGYRWLARYRASNSFTALADRSRAPLSSPNKTATEIEARMVALRQQYGWAAKKLYVLLDREGIAVSIATSIAPCVATV